MVSLLTINDFSFLTRLLLAIKHKYEKKWGEGLSLYTSFVKHRVPTVVLLIGYLILPYSTSLVSTNSLNSSLYLY